jgi:hypothetical protein
MRARAQVTILGRDGRPVGRIEREPGAPVEVTVLDEAAREHVERIAAHLAGPRPLRPEGGCVTPAPEHEI